MILVIGFLVCATILLVIDTMSPPLDPNDRP